MDPPCLVNPFPLISLSQTRIKQYCSVNSKMSDSDDDFMSDKFLVEAPTAPIKSYSERRNLQTLKSTRAGQTKNLPTLAQLEKERRYAGLNTSLFDQSATSRNGNGSNGGSVGPEGSGSGGANKATEMMMKMGWKKGEGLGKKRSPSPSAAATTKRSRVDLDDEGEAPRGGIGSASKSQTRIEPIRISMWSGRKGLSARDPSPPPLPTTSGRNVDMLDPKKLQRLEGETESFRDFQRRQFGEKEVERKEYKARELLVQFDQEQGVKVSLFVLLRLP